MRALRRFPVVVAVSLLVVASLLGLASTAYAYATVGSSGQALATSPTIAAQDDIQVIGADDLAEAAGAAAEDAEALGLSDEVIGWTGILVAVAGLVGTCYVSGDCTLLGTSGTETAAQQTLSYVVDQCAQEIRGNSGYPPWTDPDFGVAASPAKFLILDADENPIGFPNGWTWGDSSGLFCDYAEVFPEMYSPQQITQEPWQLEFCQEVATWDGGGFYAPATTAAASGTAWSWASSDQLAWVNAACPLSWLETLPGYSVGMVAGEGVVGASSGAWTTSTASCAVDFWLTDGTLEGYQASFACTGPSFTPSGSMLPLDVQQASGSSYTQYQAYAGVAMNLPAALMGESGYNYAPNGTCNNTPFNVPDGDLTVPDDVHPGSGPWTVYFWGCGSYSAQVTFVGTPTQVEFVGGAYAAVSSYTLLGSAPVSLATTAGYPVLASPVPAGVTTVPASPASLGSTPTTVAPGTGSSSTNLGDLVQDLLGEFSGLNGTLTGLGTMLLSPLTSIDSLFEALPGTLFSLFVPTDNPVTQVQTASQESPALTWLAVPATALSGFITSGTNAISSGSACGPWIGYSAQNPNTETPATLPPGITTLPVTMTTVDVPSMTLPTLPGFGVYLPSPSSSCPGGGGTIGDLDGFRSVLRGAFLFFMSWGFVIRLSRSLPWVAGSDDLAPES